ncbi:glucose/quinate/shikimate family membrane-bound PQQ-dependent dehydrogenase [Scleromatobacter humisilvae]|uniref:Glucose/quinate/shikimate family membrane-bound PQQ-dependent dehydrogenase n=1 Tax=Scleromatobacter humisilvae TaxID=2897159 RepID=A0A9X1YNQ4_9BURK|nr:glucose/quinate/shikimate family membrane-bound PQQ-dependent dehydrogenase [Scleromatobacter humisilvae]MCK9688845.1 glucose/quinate/shikimate family membrane-bound PQQ-dependent dehydrogenase [Scleromatobacter humisilvae]
MDQPGRSTLARQVTLFVLLVASAFLLIGGGWLAALSGSLYYAVAGVVLALVTILIFRRKPVASPLHALFMLGTAVWAVAECGFDFWALAPRLDFVVLLGIWLLVPPVSRRLAIASAAGNLSLIGALVVSGGVLAYAAVHDPQELAGTFSMATAPGPAETGMPDGDWRAYGRTQAGTRFSPLHQIDTGNISRLQVAWTFQTGDSKTANDPVEITDEVTPIKVGDTLYLCTPHQIAFALDAATGKLRWKFDPGLKPDPSFQHVTCRGVSYYEAPDADKQAAASAGNAVPCLRRIILPVNDGRLFELDAATGKRCDGFADHGQLDLQHLQPVTTAGMYEPTSPPIVTNRMIVVAGAVEDNFSTREPSGAIRGFDVDTGKLMWVFDPGAPDPNAIPDDQHAFTLNSPNSWAPSAYDAALDLVYLPMGVTTPDIWGGHRTKEQERFASGVLALNASTGKLAWFYQTVHHDLWDMDVPAQPTLVTIADAQGQPVPAIYAPTKTGDIFVLDRRTGVPIVPAPEKPVPQGAAKGDWTSPSQPYSGLTYRPAQPLTDADMWGATMFDQLVCRVMFHRLRYEGPFTPPSEQGTLVFPGNLGMFEWGGISVDAGRQLAIANPIALPFVSRLMPRGPRNPIEPRAGETGSGTESGIQPQYGLPYGVTLNPFLSPIGLPCKQPAWGFVSALDLRTNKVVWKKRIGTVRDSSPLPLPFKMGMPMLGGPVSTAGHVFFIGATADNYIRGFSSDTGEQLWTARLPAGGQATPMTYEAGGRQFVVIAAGGHGSFGTRLGDYVVAYALPGEPAR